MIVVLVALISFFCCIVKNYGLSVIFNSFDVIIMKSFIYPQLKILLVIGKFAEYFVVGNDTAIFWARL